jgi:NDP-sugar pyrophosphorylase family protein
MRIEVSREDALLDTGGGLKKAAWFFADSDEPFILHNVDVISNISLDQMMKSHLQHKALATLAVQDRETSRYLLFDEKQQLCGRRAGRAGKAEMVRPAAETHALAFCGIHIISPQLLGMLTENNAFSIIDSYLRLAAAGENISAFRAEQFYWRDLGRPESVELAARDMPSLKVPKA